VDLDGDGRLDLISGSYMGSNMEPGYIYLFRGISRGRFGPREMLLDEVGEPIALEMVRQRQWATAPHACDWDMDGDNDLLIGSMDGEVCLIINKGTARKYLFSATERVLEAGGRPIRVPGGEAGPRTADWDGDGLVDLLVAAADGSVLLFRNRGSNVDRLLDEGEFIIGPSRWMTQVLAVDEEPGHGRGARIHLVDWNGDGLLDLLKGDVSRYYREREDLTAEEHGTFLQLRERFRDLDRSCARLRYHMEIATFEGTESSSEREKLNEELFATRNSMHSINNEIRPYTELRMVKTGFVWVYLRK